jgi:hypothetical protein
MHCASDNDKNCATILIEKFEGYGVISGIFGMIHGV